MADDPVVPLMDRLNDGQTRLVYYLTTVSASAAALTLGRVDGAELALPIAALLLSIGCWTGGVVCGVYHLHRRNRALFANVEGLKVKQGTHETQPVGPAAVADALAVTMASFRENTDRAIVLGHRQTRFMVAGAVFYVVWAFAEKVAQRA